MNKNERAYKQSKIATKYKCNQCNHFVELEINTSIDYPYYCSNCEENRYSFEVHYSLPDKYYINLCL